MGVVLEVLCIALQVYYFVLIARIILSWIPRLPDPVQPVAGVVRAVTDPLLNPLRRALPPVRTGAMAFDLSPIVLFFGIIILQGAVCAAAQRASSGL